MMTLTTVRGVPFFVDAEDYESVKKYRWYYGAGDNRNPNRKRYITRGQWENKTLSTVYLHREIMSAKKGQIVDHIDGDPTNNCRNNLRIVTASQNVHHKTFPRRSKGPYIGVYESNPGYSSRKGKNLPGHWRATIRKNGKSLNLGCFQSARDAAMAYDAACRELRGEYATVNFPSTSTPRP